MKKIGIITFQYDNYGTKLQNFALVLMLEKMGYEVNTLYFYKLRNYIICFIKKVFIFWFPKNRKSLI